MQRGKRFTPEQENEILDLYRQNLSINKIAARLNISPVGAYGVIKRRKEPIRKSLMMSYDINSTFFDKIDTSEKAYFLGWLYTDGSNEPNRRRIRISLQEGDREMLEKLARYIGYKGPILSAKKKGDALVKGERWQCTLAFHNKQLSDALLKLGCVANKSSILTFPSEDQVPRRYWKDFIRGCVEGDGSLDCYRNKRLYFGLVGTKAFLEGCVRAIELETGACCKVYQRRSHPWIHTTSKRAMDEAMAIVRWLYADCGDRYLERKYRAMLRMEEEYKIKLQRRGRRIKSV